MSICDDNNRSVSGKGSIATLGDLHMFIGSLSLPDAKRAQLRSAIKRTDELVGHGALDLPADASFLLKKLGAFSPALAGASAGGFANLKSRLRASFRLAAPHLERLRPRPKLTGPWADLYARLEPGSQRELSRFVHFAHRQGWEPGELSDGHLERFRDHLRDIALVSDWEGVARNTILAWNRICARGEFAGLLRFSPSERKRIPYWVDPSEWPPGLRGDMNAFLANLAQPSAFMDAAVLKLKPTTVRQYRFMITTLVSAAAARGAHLSAIPRLVDAVSPANVDRALVFLHERADNKITTQMQVLAARAKIIAVWCKAPAADVEKLGKIVGNLRDGDRRRRGLTPKNRALLDRLDDERFRDLIVLLPHLLMERARKTRNAQRSSALARTAMAVELLSCCSMRRENLVTLRLDQSIRKIGHGSKATWMIEVAAEDVKNGDPLLFSLKPPTVELLEDYLANWRPRLSATPGPWLFPGSDGRAIDPRTMAGAIERHAQKIVGARITPHQFRHLSAEIFLREHPDAILTVSSHLGHRDLNTTRWFYTRSKQREASRRFQEHVVLERGAALSRIKIRKRHSLQPKSFDARDEL